MSIEGTSLRGSNPYNDAIRERQVRRAVAQARWNDPEVQRIDAERRKLESDRIKNAHIVALRKEIDKLRKELDYEAAAKAKKEEALRSAIEKLAELTESAPPIVAEPEAIEPVADPVEVEASAPRRGRPRKVVA